MFINCKLYLLSSREDDKYSPDLFPDQRPTLKSLGLRLFTDLQPIQYIAKMNTYLHSSIVLCLCITIIMMKKSTLRASEQIFVGL